MRKIQLKDAEANLSAVVNRAVALIDAGGNVLSVPVPQEFHVQATRPTRRDSCAARLPARHASFTKRTLMRRHATLIKHRLAAASIGGIWSLLRRPVLWLFHCLN